MMMKKKKMDHLLYSLDRVCAVTTAKVTKPYDDRPTEGFFKFQIVLSPMADPDFQLGRKTEQSIELERILERGLRQSGAVDAEALCIKAGEKVWQIRVDVHVLDNDGNLVDCASIAAVSALLHFRRPDVTVSGQEVIVVRIHSMREARISIRIYSHCTHISIVCIYIPIADDSGHLDDHSTIRTRESLFL